LSPRFSNLHESSNYPTISYELCHAKSAADNTPGVSVYKHCLIVGHVARALAAHLPAPLRQTIQVDVGIVGALHDVGKVSPGFQLKYFKQQLGQVCPELAGQSFNNFESNHARVSEAAIWERLDIKYRDDALAKFAEIIGSHHGTRNHGPVCGGKGEIFGGPAWSKERQKLIQKLEEQFSSLDPHVIEGIPRWQHYLLAGLICVADWIGSDESCFPTNVPHKDIDALAQEAVAERGWKSLAVRPGLSFTDIFGYTPYQFQQDFIELVEGPGIYILEAPMGTGKTEAALYAAYKVLASRQANGLYFGLPTRLTSDKMHERVVAFLHKICDGTQPVRLAHGNAWLKDYGFGDVNVGDSDKTIWFHPRKRALLYPFAVGTIDQALLGILRVKHFFVRLFGLAGKVVILDEVHSYDVYTGTLLESLIQTLRHLKCTVIILSATLTSERRTQLIQTDDETPTYKGYPAITAKTQRGMQVTEPPPPPERHLEVQVKFQHWQPKDVAEEAVDHAEQGRCVICIANTVAQAQLWYNHVKTKMRHESFPVGLLHSKFLGWRREQLENDWLKKLGKDGQRPEGCVLVATQVVEQSIDIDADYIITELAPSDMLLQRIGRLWRHKRPDRPAKKAQVTIVTGDIKSTQTEKDLRKALGKANCRVYAAYVLWRTYQVWQQYHSIRIPDKVRTLLEETYIAKDAEPDHVQQLKSELDRNREKLKQLAFFSQATVQHMPEWTDDERASTRYSDQPVVDVLLVKYLDPVGNAATIELLDGCDPVEVCDSKRDIKVLERLYRNMISIPRHKLPQAAIKTPPYLKKYFFDQIAVLVAEMDGQLTFEGQPTGLRYDFERGLLQANLPGRTKPGSGSDLADDIEVYPYHDHDDLEDTEYEPSNW